MGKKLNEGLDEFVDNGADANDITDWPEIAGGGGSPIEEGTGIKITGEDTKTISIDEEVVAKKTDIGNGTITITQGGTTKGSFDLNQKTGATIELDAGGGTTVIANPELSGEEDLLEGIQVGNTKYKVVNDIMVSTETLTFTYEDNTTETLTVVTGVTLSEGETYD